MLSDDSSDQIEMCRNKKDSNIHMEIQAKTSEAIKLRNVFFTQSLMLPNIFSHILICSVLWNKSPAVPYFSSFNGTNSQPCLLSLFD